MNNFDITKYLEMALRRKYWIIIPMLFIILMGTAYILSAKKVYEASTMILVQPQKVPESYVRTIITSDIQDRLRTITQQVTSRTNLERIIQEYQLFSEPSSFDLLIEDKIATLRDRIKINVARGNSFSITFQDDDPNRVAQVTNALASNFITENLKIRESQALGTSDFLSDELENIELRLAEKEEKLKEYRHKYMGALPDQLQTNLSMLNQTRMQLEQLNDNLNSSENRKLILQQQIAENERIARQEMSISGTERSTAEGGQRLTDLNSLRMELRSLESRYTANHPDVRRIKQMISRLEEEYAQKQENEDDSNESEKSTSETRPIGVDSSLYSELRQVSLEIEDIKEEIEKVRSNITLYQKRVEDTPKREQELLSMTRDYENIRELYSSMLNRKLEAEIAVSMEKKQKGEQFRVLDPAKVPNRPVKPDKRKLMLLTIALGLAAGCGLAYLVEFMDNSYKEPEDVEKELNLPVLMSIPFIYTEREIFKNKMKNRITMASIAFGFIICMIGVIFAAKGIEATMEYVRGMLGLI